VPAIFCANYLPFITNPPNLKPKKKLIILRYQIIETFTYQWCNLVTQMGRQSSCINSKKS
jgi:hypothetical protein